MKKLTKSSIAIFAVAFALVAVIGCSSGTTESSSGSDASASSEAAVSSEVSSDEVQLSEASSGEAQSGEASSAEEQASGASSSEAAVSSEASSVEEQSSEAASSTGQQTEPVSGGSDEVTVENAEAMGYQVFEGTVRVCTGEELIELQGIDIDPAAAGGGGTYAVLVLDGPTDVNGMGSDGSGERTESCNMLGIAEHTDYESFVVDYGDLDACKALDGQRVTLAAQTADIWFPSDVRLPIGEPSAKVSVFLS